MAEPPGNRLVKWTGYPHPLQAVLRSMMQDSAITDYTISCPEGQVQCHRFLLACASGWFATGFKWGEWQPSHWLHIDDTTISSLHGLIRVLYEGSVVLPEFLIEGFHHLAFKLGRGSVNTYSNFGFHCAQPMVPLNRSTVVTLGCGSVAIGSGFKY